MKRSVVLAAMMMLTAACAGTPSGASTASSSLSSSVPSATSATAAPSSAPSSQSPTTAAATTPTTGTVVFLPKGAYFKTAASIRAATWPTSDEQTFLVSELAYLQQVNHCVTLLVDGYRVADLMTGGVQYIGNGPTGPCLGSGAELLWGNVSGTWKELATGQNPPYCSQIRSAGWKSTIPKDFYGQQCWEKGSNVPVDYKP